jgi:hypothetical protein
MRLEFKGVMLKSVLKEIRTSNKMDSEKLRCIHLTEEEARAFVGDLIDRDSTKDGRPLVSVSEIMLNGVKVEFPCKHLLPQIYTSGCSLGVV